MSQNLSAFIFSSIGILLAEMGDKSQLLVMAFVTKYKALKVIIGVFIATILLNGLAVIVGNFITKFEGTEVYIQGISSLFFILFGLWTIRGEKQTNEETKISKYGAIVTITMTFFIGEMGDKTQLATMALAAKYPNSPAYILIGTTLGMLAADAIGILVGVIMCKKIPERIIKLISSGVFILFGFIGTYQALSNNLRINLQFLWSIIIILAIAVLLTAYYIIKNRKEEDEEYNTDFCKIREQK